MSLYLCVITDRTGSVPSEHDRRAAREIIRKRYRPCYSDDNLTVIDCGDTLETIGRTLEEICNSNHVGCMLASISADTTVVHGIEMAKCFGDSQLKSIKLTSPFVGSEKQLVR